MNQHHIAIFEVLQVSVADAPAIQNEALWRLVINLSAIEGARFISRFGISYSWETARNGKNIKRNSESRR